MSKRVLLDACVPHRLRTQLAAFDVVTARHAGLDGLTDTQLLAAAQREFDVLVTLDQSMPAQQTIAGRRFAVIVLRLRDQSPQSFDAIASDLNAAIQAAEPGQIMIVRA